MTPLIDIAVEAGDWPDDIGFSSRLEEAIRLAAEEAGAPLRRGAEVSIVLTDDAAVRRLNREWRKIDKPTNVLSFPAAEPEHVAAAALLGDVILAYETAAREAEEERKSLTDHAIHLVLHGFLHLLGHDHVERAEAERMEALETRILARLGIPDPYFGSVPEDEALR